MKKKLTKLLGKVYFVYNNLKLETKNNRPESLNVSFLIPFISFQKKLSSLRRFGERGGTV